MSKTVFFYKRYFLDFYDAQTPEVKKKITHVLHLIQELERVPEKFLKHLEGTKGLYEIRIKVGSEIFRIFCFFAEGNLVVLLSGFQKKSQKTPKNELEKAKKLREEYIHEKEKSDESK